MINIPLCICSTAFLSICLPMGISFSFKTNSLSKESICVLTSITTINYDLLIACSFGYLGWPQSEQYKISYLVFYNTYHLILLPKSTGKLHFKQVLHVRNRKKKIRWIWSIDKYTVCPNFKDFPHYICTTQFATTEPCSLVIFLNENIRCPNV